MCMMIIRDDVCTEMTKVTIPHGSDTEKGPTCRQGVASAPIQIARIAEQPKTLARKQSNGFEKWLEWNE